MRLIVLDFDSSGSQWDDKRTELLRHAGSTASLQLEWHKISAPAWRDDGDCESACRDCAYEVFAALESLRLGQLSATDVILASGIDANNLLALQGWFDRQPYPRPSMILHATQPPWHFAPARQVEIAAAFEQLLQIWTMVHLPTTSFTAESPDLARLWQSLPGFHAHARIDAVPSLPTNAAEATALFHRLFPWVVLSGGKASGGSRANRPTRLLMFAPFGEWRVHHQLDAIMARMLRNEGQFAHVIACDGLYKPCAMIRTEQNCLRCQFSHRQNFHRFDLPQSRVTEWLEPGEIAAIDHWADGLPVDQLMDAHYRDIPVGDIVASNLFTQFRITSRDQVGTPEIVAVHRRFLAGAALSALAVDRAIERLEIDRLFLFNARLYPYMAALTVAQRRGVDVVVHERSRQENSFEFFENSNGVKVVARRQQLQPWANIPLDATEMDSLDQFLTKKMTGSMGNWTSFYADFKTLEQDFYQLLDIPRGAKIIGFFTTSPDEMCLEPGYEDVLEQFDLIERFADRLEPHGYYLVVRHHPAMGGGVDNPPEITGLALAYARTLSPPRRNLRIILPNDPIASSTLYPYLDGAVALFSSVATELLACGVATVTSPASELAFFAPPGDPMVLESCAMDEVERVVEQLVRVIDHPDDGYYRRCLRSIYSVYGRLPILFRAFGIKDLYDAQFNFDDPDQLVLGFDPQLDRLYHRLTEGGQFYPDPGPAEQARDGAAEDRYVAEKLAYARQRAAARAHSKSTATAVEAPLPPILLTDIATSPDLAAEIRQHEPAYGENHRWARLVAGNLLERLPSMRQLCESCSEDWIWLGSTHFRLNGIFATRIGRQLRSAPSDMVALPLTGWFTVKDQIRPERHSAASLDGETLGRLIERAPGLVDPWAPLGLAVWRKSTLLDAVLPALERTSDHLPLLIRLVGGLAGQSVAIGEPIFLNQ